MKLRKGMQVRWHDPEIQEYPDPDEALKRIFTVDEVWEDAGVACISDDITEAEVPISELEILNRML